MSILIDDLAHKKIVLVKQILQRAIINSKSNNPVDKILSAIQFDLSVETMLKTISLSIDPSKQPVESFSPLLDKINGLLSSKKIPELPDRANILLVHKIRNNAQHDAITPSENDLIDCSTFTRNFLQKVTYNTWDKEFNTISLVGLIQHDEIKKYLLESERSLESGDFKNAVEKSSAGFETAIKKVQKAIVGRPPRFNSKLAASGASGEIKPSREYSDSIESMRKVLAFLALNL